MACRDPGRHGITEILVLFGAGLCSITHSFDQWLCADEGARSDLLLKRNQKPLTAAGRYLSTGKPRWVVDVSYTLEYSWSKLSPVWAAVYLANETVVP